MARAPLAQGWKTKLYDPGEHGDCPRSCFIGCDQFGRTHHRLRQVDRHEDPLDLSGYKECNSNCWDYFFLCIAGLYIGSGIHTAKQTRRIRETYSIKGTYGDDVAKGICCQPCSLIRNELEVRRRETEKRGGELASGPFPLGELNYQPIYAMTTEGYRSEPQMTPQNLRHIAPIPINRQAQGREVHFHLEEPGGGRTGPRIVPLYPTGHELGQLPPIPHVASPLQCLQSAEGLDRRSQVLTPISERDSLEETRVQQRRENNPIQTWLRSMSPAPSDGKPNASGRLSPCVSGRLSPCVSGRLSPCTPVPQQEKQRKSPSCEKCQTSSPCPESCCNPQKKGHTRWGKHPCLSCQSKGSKKGPKRPKSPKPGSKKKSPAVPERKTPDILVTPSETKASNSGMVPNTVRHQENFDNQVARSMGASRVTPSPEHHLSADILVPSPSESQKQHSLEADIVVPSRTGTPRQHNIQADMLVPSPPGSQRQHRIEADVLVPSPSGSQRQRGIRVDPRVPTPSGSTVAVHEISEDEPVETLLLADRDHILSNDSRVSVDATLFREHNIDLDEVVSVEEELEAESEGHDIPDDPQVSASLPPINTHELEWDSRVPTPKPLPAREHSLSRDIRVPTPTSRGPFAHGIHLDERVPTPELVRLKLDHDILQDRKALTPSPGREEHDLHANERVKSPAPLAARQHSIRSDNQVSEPSRQLREHGIQADEMVASVLSPRPKDHSVSVDTKVAQRAYQLLEHFLEQDKKSGRPSK
ncbi:hypothetical protein B0T25DRAFT_90237 [Lasiosphaeria hispida]|uniref:DUF614 domain-containing protein n=1 Tax=Lasiosphaeria hispida TaxID=260671 RepID=A0AAJ0MHK3_9PEZI|nr:hypothetical protein B0T25DRAFT_90237 [Lasiosphaeria hispida]